MKSMDVWILPHAHSRLQELRRLTGSGPFYGILLGHQRGPRYITEDILPLGERFSPVSTVDQSSPDSADRLIGFFALKTRKEDFPELLSPAFHGKILVLMPGEEKTEKYKAFMIDFNNGFYLEDIPVLQPNSERDHE